MQIEWDIVIANVGFKDRGLGRFMKSLSITHEIPKRSSTKQKRGKKGTSAKKDTAPHRAELVLDNSGHRFNGWFHKLDRAKIWLGWKSKMFYQGSYRIEGFNYKVSGTSAPELNLTMLCSSLDATRVMKSRVFMAMAR